MLFRMPDTMSCESVGVPKRIICSLTPGQFGTGEHPHEDKLSFALHAYGRPLIVDPGIGNATEGAVTGETVSDRHLRSSRAHNSLIINGKEQCRKRMSEAEFVPDPDTRWISAPSFDSLRGGTKRGTPRKVKMSYCAT